MADWKKIGRALLFPHIAIMILLLPLATVLLVASMVFVGTQTLAAYISYVLASYTLTVWCMRIPQIIRFIKSFKNQNKYAVRWSDDVRFRVNITLFCTLAWNAAYAIFQLWLGFYHSSVWFCSLAAYYLFLAAMRAYLVRHTRRHTAGVHMLTELKKYRACGVVFLIMNLALSLMIFFMVYWNRTFEHHEITTIAMAAYTFTAFTAAIVNIVRYRKYNSPVYSAAKAISLAAACVSMLTLTSTMLNTFGAQEDTAFRRLMLALIGAAVSVFVIAMAIFMIVQSTEKIKMLKTEDTDE